MSSVAELVDQASKLSDDEKNEFVSGVVSKMSVLNLSVLVKKVENHFGVKASGGGGGGVQQQAPPTEQAVPQAEKTEFTVFLKSVDSTKKIAVIKEVRTLTGLGLVEAKALVEKAPVVLKPGVPKADAEANKKKLEEAGAVVELQ